MEPAEDRISIAKIRKPHMSRVLLKTILICLFDHKDLVHVECLEQGQTRGSGSVLNWKTLGKLQEMLLYKYLNTAFMGHSGT
jgi:hypothetical protein